MIHTWVFVLTTAFTLIFFYCLFSIDLLEASSFVVNAVWILAMLAVTQLAVWGVFILLFYDTDGGFIYSDMPQSKCEEVLDALNKHSELEFLKERISRMDRRLTVEEWVYIANYHKVKRLRRQEESCKKLYGISSGAE